MYEQTDPDQPYAARDMELIRDCRTPSSSVCSSVGAHRPFAVENLWGRKDSAREQARVITAQTTARRSSRLVCRSVEPPRLDTDTDHASRSTKLQTLDRRAGNRHVVGTAESLTKSNGEAPIVKNVVPSIQKVRHGATAHEGDDVGTSACARGFTGRQDHQILRLLSRPLRLAFNKAAPARLRRVIPTVPGLPAVVARNRSMLPFNNSPALDVHFDGESRTAIRRPRNSRGRTAATWSYAPNGRLYRPGARACHEHGARPNLRPSDARLPHREGGVQEREK